MKKTEIAIVGLGGVGGYFGFKLAQKYGQNDDVRITFVARGETFEAVEKNGLTLISPEHSNSVARPANLLQDVRNLLNPDVIVICVKEYDLENICSQLKDKVRDDTILLPLMNGVDIYERIRKIIPRGIILPSGVYVASHIKQKGIVEHQGNAGKIIIGKDPQRAEYDPQLLVDLLKDAAIDVEFKENSFLDIWTKFFFIASFGLVSARYNRPIGEVNADVQLHERAALIMREIKAIAEKKNIGLPPNIIELTFQKSKTFPFQTPTSLQLDVQSGKVKNELELFAGAIINYGSESGISVFETKKIYNEIKEELLTAQNSSA